MVDIFHYKVIVNLDSEQALAVVSTDILPEFI